jgi:hypothetical protein
MVPFRLGIAKIEPRHQHPRLGDGHSGNEPERESGGAGGGDLHPVADPVGGDEGK